MKAVAVAVAVVGIRAAVSLCDVAFAVFIARMRPVKRANNKPALDRDLQAARVPFHRRKGEIEAEYARLAAQVPQKLHPKLSAARDEEMRKLAAEFNPQFDALCDFHHG